MEGTRPTRTLSLMRRRFRVAARQCKAECRAHRQENRVADQLWLEVDGLTAQVLTGIYSAETHLPQPLRISVRARLARSEEHTSELQSLMRLSYAVFCLKKKKTKLPTP